MHIIFFFLFACYGLDLKKFKSKKLNMKSLKDKAKLKDKLIKGKLDQQKNISEKLKILDKKDKYGAKFDMENGSKVDVDMQN